MRNDQEIHFCGAAFGRSGPVIQLALPGGYQLLTDKLLRHSALIDAEQIGFSVFHIHRQPTQMLHQSDVHHQRFELPLRSGRSEGQPGRSR